jgi:membrane-bound metal-dependent hydrolase YbcI (DUF457 family)
MVRRFIGVMAFLIWLFQPNLVRATQTHGGLEGLFVHQFAHLFFTFSMGLLIYWLRKRGLIFRRSWRYIQYAAFFFIAWNLDAFFSHWLLEQSGLISVENIQGMQMRVTTLEGLHWLAEIYYLSKLDHLLCVPAMLFLLQGLRRLYKSSLPGQQNKEPAA